MRFKVQLNTHITTLDEPDLKIVDFNNVTLEVCRTLSVKWDEFNRVSYAPTKQYFVDIIPCDDGHISDIREAVSKAMIMLYDRVSISGLFTLWIKGRRYSNFSCSPKDGLDNDIEGEVYAEVDSDMGFNREEWGLTQAQRHA